MKKRLLAAALAVVMLCGCVSCKKDPPAGSETGATDTTAAVTEPGTTPDTIPETDTETDAETTPDGDAWEPVAGAGVTELTVSGTIPGTGVDPSQTRDVIDAYGPNNAAYSLKEADGETLRNGTVSALRLATAFKDGTVVTYQGKVQINTDTSVDAPWSSLYIGLRLSNVVYDATSQTGVENGVVKDKQVGIFYFLWHDGTSSQPIYNHTLSYYMGGSEKLIETITSGPLGFAHYWAEPYFGYYQSNDEWVIRKHTYQLNAAGVDFIFIDTTNGLTYVDITSAVVASGRTVNRGNGLIVLSDNTLTERDMDTIYRGMY